MDLEALINDILTQHHAPLRSDLPALLAATAQTPLRRTAAEFVGLLEAHLNKEEAILFPTIAAIARGDDTEGCGILGPIRQMDFEHRQLLALEQTLRERADESGDAQPLLLRMLDDLRVHSGKEDNTLFPQALALVGQSLPEKEDEDEPSLPPPPPPRKAPPRKRRSMLGRIARRLGLKPEA